MAFLFFSVFAWMASDTILDLLAAASTTVQYHFEGGGEQGWKLHSGISLVNSTERAYEGDHSLRFVVSLGPWSWGDNRVVNEDPVINSYGTLVAHVYLPADAPQVWAKFELIKDDEWLGHSAIQPLEPGQWRTLRWVRPAPRRVTGRRRLQLVFWAPYDPYEGPIYIDEIRIEPQ